MVHIGVSASHDFRVPPRPVRVDHHSTKHHDSPSTYPRQGPGPSCFPDNRVAELCPADCSVIIPKMKGDHGRSSINLDQARMLMPNFLLRFDMSYGMAHPIATGVICCAHVHLIISHLYLIAFWVPPSFGQMRGQSNDIRRFQHSTHPRWHSMHTNMWRL